MTDFTDRARAEGERRYVPIDRPTMITEQCPVQGFIDGAEWQASQEPTDAEVEAACLGFYNDPNGLTDWTKLARVGPDLADKYRTGMRRALTAAREARA